MSNLLKEAIVDAKALKQAALKNAESAIIEKYSSEVRDTLDKLLEQDDLGLPVDAGDPGALGGDPLAAEDPLEGGFEDELEPAEEVVPDEDVPLASADGLPAASREGEPAKFDLDLGALQEAITELQGQLEESQEFEVTEEEIFELLSDDEFEIVSEEDTLEEDALSDAYIDAPGASAALAMSADSEAMSSMLGDSKTNENLDALVDSIAEKLTVDMGAELSGWAGRSNDDMHHEMERDLARRRSTDVQANLEILKKAQEELVFENKRLQEQNKQYKQATNELKESLQDVNLSNARLLYTNRVLRNASLNERQKERIVEAISRSGSVAEARTIFDTLQSTAEAKPRQRPQSLNEAITRRSSSVIRASRRESTVSDPFQERMKKLAGIK